MILASRNHKYGIPKQTKTTQYWEGQLQNTFELIMYRQERSLYNFQFIVFSL